MENQPQWYGTLERFSSVLLSKSAKLRKEGLVLFGILLQTNCDNDLKLFLVKTLRLIELLLQLLRFEKQVSNACFAIELLD